VINWKTVPPDGQARKGTMDRATIADGFEHLQFADVHAPDIKKPDLGVDFQGLWADDTHHFVGGRLYVSADTRPNPGTILTAEVRVYGLVCGVKDIIVTGTVSTGSGPLVAQLSGYKQSFVTIGVEARKLINGLPSAVRVPALSFGIAGRLFR